LTESTVLIMNFGIGFALKTLSCTDNGLTRRQCLVSLNECLLRDACCQTVYWWWAVNEEVSGISVVTRWLRPLYLYGRNSAGASMFN